MDDQAVVKMTGFNSNIYSNVEPDNQVLNVSAPNKRNLAKGDKVRLSDGRHDGRNFTKKILSPKKKPEDHLY
jgi:hypothetical protein